MGLTGTTVLRAMRFTLNEDLQTYVVDDEDHCAMNKIVAKGSLRVTSVKTKKITQSIMIIKDFITGVDVANAIVKCEEFLRNMTWKDPDHMFFEGFGPLRAGDKEVTVYRWGA